MEMLVDLTYKVTKLAQRNAFNNEQMSSFGHLGTHFDVMNKVFPLDFLKRDGIAFDVTAEKGREIEANDIDLRLVHPKMFVAFYTGFIELEAYGSVRYFKEHPILSNDLIDQLLELQVSIIGIDFAGVRRGDEHTPKDQYCADRGVFIVENLCNLASLLEGNSSRNFIANTFPINFEGMSGLPCRVVAELP